MRPDVDLGHYAKRRLLIEVTHTADVRFVTGIQRVVLRLLQALGEKPNVAFDVVAVHLRKEGGLFRLMRAVQFEQRITGNVHHSEAIKVRRNDVLFMLDSSWDKFPRYAQTVFPVLRSQGGQVISCLYDIIPVTHAQYCERNVVAIFNRWLPLMLKNSDAVLSISKATQDALVEYLADRGQDYSGKLGFFHLGADFRAQGGLPQMLPTGHIPTVLMVGTIEPRKGYGIALDAFELLWAREKNVRLHIVGKFGWLVQDLVKRLKANPRFGSALLLTMDASDESLAKAYAKADVVLSASYAEGFGLPLVEAAAFGKSLVVSDIPPYREICGEDAIYFDAGSAESLAAKIATWLDGRRLPSPPAFISWSDSADQLLSCISDMTSNGPALLP